MNVEQLKKSVAFSNAVGEYIMSHSLDEATDHQLREFEERLTAECVYHLLEENYLDTDVSEKEDYIYASQLLRKVKKSIRARNIQVGDTIFEVLESFLLKMLTSSQSRQRDYDDYDMSPEQAAEIMLAEIESAGLPIPNKDALRDTMIDRMSGSE